MLLAKCFVQFGLSAIVCTSPPTSHSRWVVRPSLGDVNRTWGELAACCWVIAPLAWWYGWQRKANANSVLSTPRIWLNPP